MGTRVGPGAIITVTALLLACYTFISHAAKAQTVDPLDTTQVEVAGPRLTFSQALAEVSKQARVNVVALDSPRVIRQSNFNVRGTARAALDAIAETFDYRWNREPNGAILLTKRFHLHDEHPQFSAEEALELIRSIKTTLPMPDLGGGPDAFANHLRSLYTSMSPDQRAQAARERGLPASALLPIQKRVLERAVLAAAFGQGLPIWDEVESQLSALSSAEIENREPPGDAPAGPVRSPTIRSERRLGFLWPAGGRRNRTELPHAPGLLVSPEALR